MVAGATYTFTLSAAVDGGVAGAASVGVVAAAAPTSGTLTITPASGVALETLFALATADWASADPPLSYGFRATVDGATTTLRAPTLEATLERVVLAAGDALLEVLARDALGGEATAAATAAVSAPDAASLADACGGREIALRIWNDAGREIWAHPVDPMGREGRGLPVGYPDCAIFDGKVGEQGRL